MRAVTHDVSAMGTRGRWDDPKSQGQWSVIVVRLQRQRLLVPRPIKGRPRDECVSEGDESKVRLPML